MTSEESGLNLGLHDCQALACAPFDLGLEALKQHRKEKEAVRDRPVRGRELSQQS